MAAYSRRFSRRASVADPSSFAARHSAANLLWEPFQFENAFLHLSNPTPLASPKNRLQRLIQISKKKSVSTLLQNLRCYAYSAQQCVRHFTHRQT